MTSSHSSRENLSLRPSDQGNGSLEKTVVRACGCCICICKAHYFLISTPPQALLEVSATFTSERSCREQCLVAKHDKPSLAFSGHLSALPHVPGPLNINSDLFSFPRVRQIAHLAEC